MKPHQINLTAEEARAFAAGARVILGLTQGRAECPVKPGDAAEIVLPGQPSVLASIKSVSPPMKVGEYFTACTDDDARKLGAADKSDLERWWLAVLGPGFSLEAEIWEICFEVAP